ncbi:MAG: GtrA family protein [Bacteroides sp.]
MIDWKDKDEVIRILKFVIVGMLNTLITYVVYVVMRWVDFSPECSNLVGYIVGLINSFIWNKFWVFQAHHTNIFREMFYFFVLAFGIAYGVQYAFFKTMIDWVGMNEYLAQFLGLFVYGGINFVLNRVLTFTSKP